MNAAAGVIDATATGVPVTDATPSITLQGQKTAALEVVDTPGDTPDYLVLPVGNVGNITACRDDWSRSFALTRPSATPSRSSATAGGCHAATNQSTTLDNIPDERREY